MMEGAPQGILAGVRVLDFGRYVAGPYCATLLGYLGAEVIRVERREGGEDRYIAPVTPQGEGAVFLQCSPNKRSLTLDPTTPQGREVVHRLVATADIVVANLPAAALRHVEARSEDLAQARPECGHATNAIAIVGRRSRTRGLFLDRRAFLVSYDPEGDDDGARLARVLAGVVPVGAGINLEYWFSYVDPIVYGCGTKLPHNITAYLGVMDGHQSDLRTGLPWQMVEIHEPLRLLTIVEARPERLLAIAAQNPTIGRLVTGQWVQLIAWDPDEDRMWRYTAAGFIPAASTMPDPATAVQ
jgi:hypothetical protein